MSFSIKKHHHRSPESIRILLLCAIRQNPSARKEPRIKVSFEYLAYVRDIIYNA